MAGNTVPSIVGVFVKSMSDTSSMRVGSRMACPWRRRCSQRPLARPKFIWPSGGDVKLPLLSQTSCVTLSTTYGLAPASAASAPPSAWAPEPASSCRSAYHSGFGKRRRRNPRQSRRRDWAWPTEPRGKEVRRDVDRHVGEGLRVGVCVGGGIGGGGVHRGVGACGVGVHAGIGLPVGRTVSHHAVALRITDGAVRLRVLVEPEEHVAGGEREGDDGQGEEPRSPHARRPCPR